MCIINNSVRLFKNSVGTSIYCLYGGNGRGQVLRLILLVLLFAAQCLGHLCLDHEDHLSGDLLCGQVSRIKSAFRTGWVLEPEGRG